MTDWSLNLGRLSALQIFMMGSELNIIYDLKLKTQLTQRIIQAAYKLDVQVVQIEK